MVDYHTQQRQMASAQRAYDNMTPPDQEDPTPYADYCDDCDELGSCDGDDRCADCKACPNEDSYTDCEHLADALADAKIAKWQRDRAEKELKAQALTIERLKDELAAKHE